MIGVNLVSSLAASEVSLFDVNSWWWAIQKGLYWVINAIQGAYNYLAGITPVNNTADSPNPDMMGDLLFNLFNDNRITQIWSVFMIIAAALLIIFLVVGLVKVHFKNEDQLASRGKMVGKSFGAFFTMLILPMVMFVAVFCVGYLMQAVSDIMNKALGNTDSDMSIANIIHQICLPSDLKKEYFEKVSSWDVDYSMLETAGVNTTYNYVLGMLSSGILIYVLITVCLTLVERLIDVIGLYLLAPFTLSRAPLDDGNSFNLWKDLVITRMISAGGIIIFMYLYFLLMGNVLTWFNPLATDSSSVIVAKSMVKILFVIGGAFSAKKGALLIAQMVSQNAGIAEGMSQQQSMHMLSSGLSMGSRALFTAMTGIGKGALMAAGGAKSAGATATRTAMANAGGARITANPSDGNIAGRNMTSGISAASPGSAGGGAGSTGGKADGTSNLAAASVGGDVGNASGSASLIGAAGVPADAGDGGVMLNGTAGSLPETASNGADSASSARSSAFQNPNLPGKAGEIARVNRGYSSAREAMLYGGIAGAAGYGLARGFGAVGAVIKRGGMAVANKVKASYGRTHFAQNRSAMKEAQEIGRGAAKIKRESDRQNRYAEREDRRLMPRGGMSEANMEKSLKRDFDRINRVNDKIQKRYGGLGQEIVSRMQNQANKHRMDLLDSKIKKFKLNSNVGAALAQKFEQYGRSGGGEEK